MGEEEKEDQDVDLDDLLRMPGQAKRRKIADPLLPELQSSNAKMAGHLNAAKMTLANAKKTAKSADTFVEFKDVKKKDDAGPVHMEIPNDKPEPNEEEPVEKTFEEMRLAEEKSRKKEEKRKRKILAKLPNPEDEVDGARKISHEIYKNKGLTRKRKKLDRNARVKNRVKYDKALKKRKTMVQEIRQGRSDGGYDGEKTGVRSH